MFLTLLFSSLTSSRKDILKIIIENNIWAAIWLEGETIVSGHHGNPTLPKQTIVDTLARLKQRNLKKHLKNLNQSLCEDYIKIDAKLLSEAFNKIKKTAIQYQ